MNIKLVYNKSSFNIDILKDTPCKYLFEVAQKAFRIPIDQMILTYEDTELQNNSRLIFSVMDKNDPENITGDETIFVSKIKKQKSINSDNSNCEESIKLPYINPNINDKGEKIKLKKKSVNSNPILCQICNHKNSIFYCRICNLFICFECNVRFNEHKNHDRINLEDGDSFLGCDVYREELLKEINIIEIGYQKTLEWMIDNEDREKYLQELFKLLEQIRNNSMNLSDVKTLYNLNQETINDFRIEIDKIPVPKHREDIFEIYGNLNLKENELRNYIKFLNLQIVKTEYNKVFLIYLDTVKKNLEKLSIDVKSKLNECEDIKLRGLEEVELYIKESKLDKNKMEIGNYLSKNYNGNHDKYTLNMNNLNLSNENIFLNRKKNNENNNNAININNISNSSSSRVNINTFNKDKKIFNGRNNNSLYEKDISKTVNNKNKPIKLIMGGNIENLKKKIKKFHLNNNLNNKNNNDNFSVSNKDNITTKKYELSPLKITKKNIFNIKDNETNKITHEKPKKNKINLTLNQYLLSDSDFKDEQDIVNNINESENKNKNKENNNKKDDSEKNNVINKKQKSGVMNKVGIDNDLIKPKIDDEILTKLKKDSIIRALTSSEKKLIFNPPLPLKNNSYGKAVLNKKRAILENIQ